MPERWKLDPSEDPSRRRMKLKRNFKYRQYRGSSDDPSPHEDGRGLQRIDSKLLAGAVSTLSLGLAWHGMGFILPTQQFCLPWQLLLGYREMNESSWGPRVWISDAGPTSCGPVAHQP